MDSPRAQPPSWLPHPLDEACPHCDGPYVYESVAYCVFCDEPVCPHCVLLVAGEPSCPGCAQVPEEEG